jgi:signal peptidase I
MTQETQDDAPSRAGTREPRKGRGWKIFIRDLLVIFVAALLISFLIKTFLIRSFYIPSSSMEQTLHIDDRIIVNQLEPKLMPVQHGDVVVFKDPGGWLTPTPQPQVNWFVGAVDAALAFVGLSAPDSNDHLIKRVIGLPGDTVELRRGSLFVNGSLVEESYLSRQFRDSDTYPPLQVSKGYYYVLGDHRNSSNDSRSWGEVPEKYIYGKAFVRFWPLSKIGFIR